MNVCHRTDMENIGPLTMKRVYEISQLTSSISRAAIEIAARLIETVQTSR